MPHFRATIVKLLAAVISLSAASSAAAAAKGGVTDSTRTGAVVDVWPEGRMPGRGANEPEADRELGARFARGMQGLQRRRVTQRRL